MKILAALDESPANRPVRRFAEALARLLGVPVDAVTILEREAADGEGLARVATGPPIERLGFELGDPDVVVGVIGARGLPGGRHPAGHVAVALLESAPCPIVVVPPDHRLDRPLRRILVPLEGLAMPSGALERAVRLLGDTGIEVVSLHVFTERTTPAFWEGWHDAEMWGAEFGARYAPRGATLELRSGNVCSEILVAAAHQDIDLVVVEWKQDLSAGHAAVVRALLDRSPLPVLLVPEHNHEEDTHGTR